MITYLHSLDYTMKSLRIGCQLYLYTIILNKGLSINFKRKKFSSKLCVKIYPIVLHLIKYLLMHYPIFELPSGSNPQDSNISLTSYMLFSAHELNTHL